LQDFSAQEKTATCKNYIFII